MNEGRKEGSPIALLEAMANGRIVIGSNVSGICDQLELFPENLFNAGNLKELVEKIEKYMLKDRNSNNMLGSKFFQHVQNNYCLSIERKSMENYYKELIS